MRNLIEKLILTTLIIFGMNLYIPDVNPVPYGLITIFISLLLDLDDNRKITQFLYLAFSGLCIYDGIFISFIPLILYNLINYNYLMSSLVGVFLLYDFNIYTISLALLSIYLSRRRIEHEILTLESKSIRDNLTENTLNLSSHNKQLLAEREQDVQIAILNERNRISKELHESVGHLVSSSILQVQALALTTTDENSIAALSALQDRLTAGMKEIRESIHNIHNESLELENAIVDIINDYPNLKVLYKYDLRTELPYSMKFDILSIIKEAIINTNKHSTGEEIQLQILEHPSFISISIKDNGNVDSNKIKYNGMGLVSIEEIVDKHSGFINYDLSNGFGTHITFMKEDIDESHNN